ncbi:tetrapyrrole biosynthesis, uroporphyrinogen III synthase [Rhodocollybia butyracea]|uniref:Tetrapyrrole biosynthesis, uroporphyrinogen III synthase n=1 Tax=Rhodocollybia butyracea TaxID=206335 RepID=A0A9P5PXM4_9AGAR|nr:tetrapyrrole biosynthesis, uroporphyrinogen III synthase [Rhodocollybia butyracea]
MKLNCIFLRALDASSPDKYEAAFDALGPGCKGVCVPVLETILLNIDKLKEVITRKPTVDAVIMTSARSCEAWKTAFTQSAHGQTESWSNVLFYVVGATTAAVLRDIYQSTGQIRGEQTGTAEQLAKFILEDLPHDRPKCLLYLTGDKNRDTLASALNKDNIDLKSIQVYGTRGSARFPADLSEALKNLERDADWWITFFAPSAAEFVYPHLQAHFRFQSVDVDASTGSLPLAQIASIGPTTASFLHDSLQLYVNVVSTKPNPDALVAAIRDQSEQLYK